MSRKSAVVISVGIALGILVISGIAMAASSEPFELLYGDKGPDEGYLITITRTVGSSYAMTATVEILFGDGPDGVWLDSYGRLGVRDRSAEWVDCPECATIRCDRVGDSLFCRCPCEGDVCGSGETVTDTVRITLTVTTTPTPSPTPTREKKDDSTPTPTVTTPPPTATPTNPPTATPVQPTPTFTPEPTALPFNGYLVTHYDADGTKIWTQCKSEGAAAGHLHHSGHVKQDDVASEPNCYR